MFEKILIANRGMNAVRIARTCERMGIATVAIYNEADQNSLHVRICDEAHCIGSSDVDTSYRNADAIIEVAKKSGAQAIHPGVDLLSESPEFAHAVEDAGLVFVGPSAKAIETFSNKLKAREVALKTGMRIIKATDGPIADFQEARQAAMEIGYPLAVKAATRGAGIALHVVKDDEQLEQVFGKKTLEPPLRQGPVYLESYIERPRHVEVQIAADKKGEYLALGECECSIQRRYKKIVEESPAPLLTTMARGDVKRKMLSELAILLAKETDYYGIGTAEFVVDAENRFYFLGFAPRLQVEHLVTELCTDLDLVEIQIRIAANERLPSKVQRSESLGHAIEARIYAEDPAQNFQRSLGKISELRWPTVAPGKLRIETGFAQQSEIMPFDNPLLAKVVTYGPSRNRAVLALDRILAEAVISPITTNIAFLRAILQDQSFQAGQFDATFCDSLVPS
jgi:acetyl/propionyl-CoA carboxylase alpha subunit